MTHLKPAGFRPGLAFSIENLSFAVISVSCGRIDAPIPAHCHGSGCYEIHYIPAGYGTVVLNRRVRRLSLGCLWTAGPLCEHTQLPLRDEPMWEYCLYLTCRRAPVSREDPFLSLFAETSAFLGQDAFDMERLFALLLQELSLRAQGSRYMAEALLRQLIVCTARNYEAALSIASPALSRPSIPENGSLQSPDASERFLHRNAALNAPIPFGARRVPPSSVPEGESLRIEQYFLGDCSRLSLKALSDQLGVGPRQTQRMLHSLYGKTFQQKALEARMEQAVVLLTQTPDRIGTIAGRLGYSSAEHFSAAFRGYYGMTPRDCRKTEGSRFLHMQNVF